MSQPISNQESRPIRLKNQLCFPLYACSRKITSLYTPLLKPFGLTYTQYICLMTLWEEDGQKVGSIAQKLLLDTGTLTPMLKTMEKEGLIRRTRDPEDERSVLVNLTDAGKEMESRLADIPLCVGSCVMESLSPEEAATMYRLLYKIIDKPCKE